MREIRELSSTIQERHFNKKILGESIFLFFKYYFEKLSTLAYEKYFYAVYEEDSIQMIYLMLYDSSSKISEFHGIGYSFMIHKSYFDPRPTFYITTFSRDRKTSLSITTTFRRVFYDFWIYQGNSLKIFIFVISHQRYDDYTLVYTYLRSCKSYSSIITIAYMFEHILDEVSIR